MLGRTQELGLDIHWFLSFLDLDLDLFPDLVTPEIKKIYGKRDSFKVSSPPPPNGFLSPRKYE